MVTDASLPADEACVLTEASRDSVLVQLDGDAAALFDPLNAFFPGRRLLVGAV